ncbi:Uncharacterised protein [Lelliottia amnigena]|jgi:cell shape-determining protein MreC|uniref:hypothetical protein n=1 Tax=Lelliottia TaxID=1330545 RepID=UPI000ACDCC62|nr:MULTISPECIES: hypothetical protein [Lelliottia]QXA22442.1 hypothetical protein I6L74_03135 [Lelliottia amnigena]CAI9404330.1 hypothetical protein CCAJJPOJ_04004 [Lelliottia sp. T2.26D-8]VDZ90248.1 Uncharacterised protein [Lelliottia amnigena]
MNTFSIIAIPFFVVAIVMLALAATRKERVFLITGGVFMISSVVNAVIGLSL